MEFRSILFIPAVAPPGFLDNYYGSHSGLDLYVRRVFITNELEELIPRCVFAFLARHVSACQAPIELAGYLALQTLLPMFPCDMI